jgi:hypothetical protein
MLLVALMIRLGCRYQHLATVLHRTVCMQARALTVHFITYTTVVNIVHTHTHFIHM